LWIGLLFLGLLWGRGAAEPAAAQGGSAAEILRLVNEYRAQYGLPPYQYNGTLALAAQNHAAWMANTVTYSHTQSNGSTPQSRANAVGYNGYVSEIIVGGWSMTPGRGLIWWKNSALHNSMMLSNRYSEAGPAVASNGRENMYVIVIGRPSDRQVSPASSTEPQAEPLMITPITLAKPREDGAIVHTVLEGQALWQIAAHYEVDLAHLYLINGLNEDSFLQPGDEVMVRLPDGATPPPTPTPPLSHVVREGDNPWIIAVRYNVDLESFFYLNGFDENTILQPGEEVRVRLAPGEPPPPTPTPRLTHIVREGETLWTVAALNGLSLDELLAYNGLDQGAMIYPGDELAVRPLPTATPTATQTPAPTTAPTATAPQAEVAQMSQPAPPSPTALSQPTPTATPLPDGADDGEGGSFFNTTTLFTLGLIILAGLLFWRGRT
jgi:LysM repeat protein